MSTTLADNWRTARKVHECELCRRRIDAGERYRDVRAVFDCQAYTYKTCGHCEAAIRVFDLWREVDQDQGIQDFHLDEYDPADENEAHIQAGWRARWRKPDGSLWEMPEKATEGGVS